MTWRAYAAVGMRAGQSTLRALRDPGAATAGHGLAAEARRRASRVGHGRRSPASRARRDAPGGVAQTALLVARAESRRAHAKRRRAEAPRPRAETTRKKRRPPEPSCDDDDDDEPERLAALPRRGPTPGRLLEELTETHARARRDRSTGARRSRCSSARARAPVHTWSRPSRRFPGRIFEVPGRSWAPRRDARAAPAGGHRHVAQHDASTSSRRSRGSSSLLVEHAHITIAECDVAVARVYPFAGRIENVVGRGGTDLRPGVRAGAARRARRRRRRLLHGRRGPVPEGARRRCRRSGC